MAQMSQIGLQTGEIGVGKAYRVSNHPGGFIRAALAEPEDLDEDELAKSLSDSKEQIPNGSQKSLPLGDGTVVSLPETTTVCSDDRDDADSIGQNGQNHAKLFLKMVSRDSRRSSQSGTTGTGVDDMDSVSLYSLYMDHDFRYFFQHPYMRLAVAYLVIFCNFLVYAEDPVAHSETECFIPVIGNCFSFIFTRYPRNAWALLKVVMWLLAIVFGLIVGKYIFHTFIFNRWLHLRMFGQDQGSWMTMFFSVIFFLFLFSYVYNLLLLMGGDATLDYRITEYMGIRNSTFMKGAATGTWCGDLFTAWMVTDVMLQERLYPNWAPRLRAWWNAGWRRIVLFWVTVGLTSLIFITVISTDWINWDEMNHDFMPTSEVSRAYLASFILVMDLLIVMQDWDFPHFVNNFDIKLPGVNKSIIKLHIPNLFQAEKFVIHITGKWFNYGILYIVMMLDLNMWKNQIFYTPPGYGQFVGPNDKIYTVRDQYSLDNLMDNVTLSYDWRSTNINPLLNISYLESDLLMNSKYLGYTLNVKCTAFVPSLAAFACFGFLVWYFGRYRPSPSDPHGGRIKKRRKMYQRYSGKLHFRRSVSRVENQKRITLKAMRVYTDGGPSIIFDGKELKDYVLLESAENGKHITIQETSMRPSYCKSSRIS